HSSETQMRALFEAMTDIVLVLDAQGNTVQIAPTNRQLVEQNTPTIINQTIEQFLQDRQAETFCSQIQQALKTQQTVNFEYSLIYNSTEIWFNAKISPIAADLVLWVARDVTESKRYEKALQNAHNQLERRVEERTAELLEANRCLKQEISDRQKATEALQRSESRYRSLIIATTQAVWTTNATGQTTEPLPTWQNLTGQTDEDVQGWGWLNAIHPDERERVRQQWNRTVSTKRIYQTEYRLRMVDGSYRDMAVRGVPIFAADRSIQEWVGTCTDITERKAATEQLQHQTLRSQLVSEITLKIRQSLQLEEILQTTVTEVQNLLQADRVLIFQIQPDGSGTVVQEAVLPGWAVILGQTILDPCLKKDYINKYTQGIITAIADLKQAQIERCHVEMLQQFGVKANLVVPILMKDNLWGLLIAHQCSSSRQWTSVEIELLLQLANQVSIALAQAELLQALQDSEAKFRQLAESIEEVFFIYLPDYSEILYISPAYEKIWGNSVQSLYQNPSSWMELIHPDDRDRVEIALQNQIEIGGFNEEYRIIRADGDLRWIYGRTFLVHNQVGEVDRIVGIAVDITARKQAEEAILEAKNKEILLQEIHHRVKNNLQIVSGLLYLQSRYVEDERMLSMFQESRDRVQSMALIHEKLYGSKMIDSLDFQDYIHSLTNHLCSSYDCTTKGVSLQLNIEPISLDIDLASPCGLIVNELVTNALKHAFPPGHFGEITVEFHSAKDNNFILDVRDNGVGMAEEIDISTQKSLGLRLVRSLAIKQLKGTVEVDKTVGTRFQIKFPKK
ncbi:MAG TPA: hypothetical protein DD379_25945, partial [Cyanobacteria bacterium UBA11162]|nr:hypothetical protein [Cyanobacteria bacterium UBA11162]